MVSDAEAGLRAVQPRYPKYGRFQLNERFNSDQVPLPVVNGQSETWASKGSKRVSIAQPFSGLEKRQCTIQPTIGPGGKLMQCAIIFRGTGKRISKVEKKAYDPRVDVFFQKNAWADSDFCMVWAERCFRKSLIQGAGGGARGGIAADVGQLARTDHGKVQGIHEEGVQLAGVALPRRVHGRTAAHRCRPWGTHQGRGWQATRHMV